MDMDTEIVNYDMWDLLKLEFMVHLLGISSWQGDSGSYTLT
jgi:hypothetical protein